MILLLPPVLSVLGVLWYAYWPKEASWKEDVKIMQYEALRHEMYSKTGYRFPSWSRMMPAIKMKERGE